MDLVVVHVLVSQSNDGSTASLSSFLPSPFALIPSSFVSLVLEASLFFLSVPSPSWSCQPLFSLTPVESGQSTLGAHCRNDTQ